MAWCRVHQIKLFGTEIQKGSRLESQEFYTERGSYSHGGTEVNDEINTFLTADMTFNMVSWFQVRESKFVVSGAALGFGCRMRTMLMAWLLLSGACTKSRTFYHFTLP